jgi:glucose-1-phosphate thymidylyltransferase|tara:strand:+ start:1711 stop:2715 length:1005 start_codon:yes stop_codon:yes gene_type:complete
VPMAGRGSRLRPHSLTIPKPMLPVAGTPIVHQLISTISKVIKSPIDEVAYIIGEPAFFGKEIEKSLIKAAKSIGAKATIYRQLEPLGTGHAVMCALPSLHGPAIVAFADTLIRADLEINPEVDGMIWVKKVKNPESYGVIELNKKKQVKNLIEKPKSFVSNLAAIGVYYFKEIEILKNKLQEILLIKKEVGEEYQINEGIISMINEGYIIEPGKVSHWMDCGNPSITIETNTQMLKILSNENVKLISSGITLKNSKIIPPCYIGNGVQIINSKIGPGVSIGENTRVKNSQIKHSLIQNNSIIQNAKLVKSMIGNNVNFNHQHKSISIGDYSQLK